MGELLILLQTFHAQWILKRSIKITARVENTRKVSLPSENLRRHFLALVRKMRTSSHYDVRKFKHARVL